MAWYNLWEKTPWGRKDEAKAKEETAAELPAELKDLKGLPKQFLRFLRTPKGAEVAKKLQALMEQMKQEGIDLKDEAAVKAWLERHKGELEGASGPAPVTFVHDGPQVGRNDPCHCGSGKKFKKCHGLKAVA